MAKLMEGGAVPVDRLEIGCRRRHLHEIARRAVEGPVAADAEIDAGRRDQRLGLAARSCRAAAAARPSRCPPADRRIGRR